MNKLEELREQIAKITSAIQENYPELSQDLRDMPDDSPEQVLSEYYDGLLAKFRASVAQHQLQNANRKYKDHHL